MNKSVVVNCLAAVEKAKLLSNLNIFISDTFTEAISEASSRNSVRSGTLNGRLVTFKDNFCTESVVTTCGSRMLEGYRPPFNATVVERVLKAGALSLGKTNMDEFGMGSVR